MSCSMQLAFCSFWLICKVRCVKLILCLGKIFSERAAPTLDVGAASSRTSRSAYPLHTPTDSVASGEIEFHHVIHGRGHRQRFGAAPATMLSRGIMDSKEEGRTTPNQGLSSIKDGPFLGISVTLLLGPTHHHHHHTIRIFLCFELEQIRGHFSS